MTNEIKTFEEAEKEAMKNNLHLNYPDIAKIAATLWQQSNLDRIKELEEGLKSCDDLLFSMDGNVPNHWSKSINIERNNLKELLNKTT